MPTVNPDTFIARVDEKARFSDLEVTGDFYLGDAMTSTGPILADGGVRLPIQVISGDGAITIKSGAVFLTKGSAAAITLAAPTAVTDDGKVLYVISGSAFAHVLTITGAAGGSGQDVGTFGTAINDGCCLIARNGTWYIAGAPRNVTFA